MTEELEHDVLMERYQGHARRYQSDMERLMRDWGRLTALLCTLAPHMPTEELREKAVQIHHNLSETLVSVHDCVGEMTNDFHLMMKLGLKEAEEMRDGLLNLQRMIDETRNIR